MIAVRSKTSDWKLWSLVFAAILLLIGALKLSGVAPSLAASDLFQASFGSARSFSGLLRELTPLLLLGISVFLALQAGLFNIGAEGQFLVGAMASAAIALRVPNAAGMVLAILVGSLAGGLWALPAAWIKAYRGGHEVITTIMLNNIAIYLTTAIVAGPLKDPSQQSTTSVAISSAVHIPSISFGPELEVSLAVPVALGMAAFLWFWLKRNVAGYELRAVGAGPVAATFAGISAKAVQFKGMLVSGAVAGLAGAVQVLAYENRFYAGFSPGYGFDALGVALLAGSSALNLLPSALAFAMLNQGATRLTIEGVPRGITNFILGLLIIIFAAFRYGRRNINRG